MDFYSEILEQITTGKLKTKDQLQCAKVLLCKKYKLSSLPTNSKILEHASEEIYEQVEPFLQLKPVRTASGVAVVAVMTSPYPCPHGKCIYCPGGVEKGTAQSYTGKEPAALRAAMNRFDPFLQTKSRIEQLKAIGHPTDKLDLIIMGGTFTSREHTYQRWFVKRCFDAMNAKPTHNLAHAQCLNETAKSRCIGMTIETRPDWCREEHLDRILQLGATRVELGVQTIYEEILKRVERGHTLSDTIDATRMIKDSGLKLGYHMMPGLIGVDLSREIENFKKIFKNPNFKPDMLKIYPTLVIKDTKLYDLWKSGMYDPLNTERAVKLLAKVKRLVPKWIRIQRIQRDIPVQLIEAGVKKSHLRQLVLKKMKEKGLKCKCIRCREIGHRKISPTLEDIKMSSEEYEASEGVEKFLSFEDVRTDTLIGYVRLRKPSDKAHRKEIKVQPCGIVRELKVLGQMVPINQKPTFEWQHRGYGMLLLEECERIVKEQWAGKKILVNSGVGARNYYRKLGYERNGPYMSKILN